MGTSEALMTILVSVSKIRNGCAAPPPLRNSPQKIIKAARSRAAGPVPAAGSAFTFLGERYRRIARRRGSKRAIVAISRSIMVIAWHLLSDPGAQFHDLGPGFYAARIDPERRKRTHVRQLEALGYTVTLQPAA